MFFCFSFGWGGGGSLLPKTHISLIFQFFVFHKKNRCSIRNPETATSLTCIVVLIIGGFRGGGVTGVATPPLQFSKIKESNKTKHKIEDNPLEKEEMRKSCMFV